MKKTKDLLDKSVVSEDFEEDIDATYNDLYYRTTIDKLSQIYGSLEEEKLVRENEYPEKESFSEAKERLQLDSEVIHSFTANVDEDRKLRKGYAKILIWLLFIQLLFFNGVFVACGLEKLAYEESTLRLYIGGGLLEIVSLVAIIVKYLFKDNVSMSLNSILEKNKKDK